MEICVQSTVDTLITSKNGYPADQLHSRDNATANSLDTRIRVSCVLCLNAFPVHWPIWNLFFYSIIRSESTRMIINSRKNFNFAHNHYAIESFQLQNLISTLFFFFSSFFFDLFAVSRYSWHNCERNKNHVWAIGGQQRKWNCWKRENGNSRWSNRREGHTGSATIAEGILF